MAPTWVKDQVGSDGLDVLKNVERLNFKDGAVALDIGGNGGVAYRLYQAALNRAPDQAGFNYWVNVLNTSRIRWPACWPASARARRITRS